MTSNGKLHNDIHADPGMISSFYSKVLWLYFGPGSYYTAMFKFLPQVNCLFHSHYQQQSFIRFLVYSRGLQSVAHGQLVDRGPKTKVYS